ncbi:MFS transporter [Glaciimonas sp. PCH181]|uniref:MFS transporter n=1 Tax=Glaciimonas sp. PCH181 TaxID=2133943 RepID=UPI000D36DE64|nr:MFS transporter [Glaciimonas sp. PCH181]PUA19855.1 MFS transporter [Glaciimonas sp. PCH181]
MNHYVARKWLPDERPTLPGSPSTPAHSTPLRFAYGIVGFIVAITGGLGNALVSANLINLQGTLGAYSTEVAWLPAAYVMTNVTMSLLLVKFRQQFGLRLFTEAFVALYALVTFAHLFVNDLSSAIAVRAAHGMAGAALSTLGLYYMLQAFPAKWRLKGIAVGLGAAQLALPIARIISTDLLQIAAWRGLYLFELGLALLSLGCVLLLKLPPSDRFNTFERLDFLTFGLFAPGVALMCAVFSLGRIVWWLETPWIGMALAGAIGLIATALVIESRRDNPLLNTRWLTSGRIVRWGLAMILIRIVLSEQATGAVGFLQVVGLNNDQMHGLFAVVLIASVAGIAASALTLNPNHLMAPVVVALLLMGAGALIDAQATNQTRPVNMLVSQFLLAFGSVFFLGPAMISGISGVIAEPRNLVSFSVMFGMCQNLGGLIGSAAMGTFQVVREKFHSSQLVEHLSLLDPQVAARVQAGAAVYGKVLGDPTLRNAEGISALGAAATREANVLAYNDTFILIAVIAILTAAWIFCRALWLRRVATAAPASAPPSGPAPDAKSASSPMTT